VLARIPPTQLGLWSFAVAIAHGAGLMLVPIYLGLCRGADLDKAHEAAGALIDANLGMAVLVAVVHSVAMIAAGGLLAWLVYRYLGLKFLSRSWVNLDAIWAFSLISVGALSLAISVASHSASRNASIVGVSSVGLGRVETQAPVARLECIARIEAQGSRIVLCES
jgi:hypothetical protein